MFKKWLNSNCYSIIKWTIKIIILLSIPFLIFKFKPIEIDIINLLGNLFLGVVSGIIATFIIYVIKFVWKARIEPYIINQLYTGFRVEGVWYEEHKISDTNILQKSTIYINQIGSDLNGRIEIYKEVLKEFKAFQLKGKIVGNLVSIMTYNQDTSQMGAQSYVLVAASDGRVLGGQKSYYEISETEQSKQVLSLEIFWTREIKAKDDENNLEISSK